MLLLIMLAYVRWRPREAEVSTRNSSTPVDLTPWPYARPVAVLLLIGIVGLYVLFSPLGLAA